MTFPAVSNAPTPQQVEQQQQRMAAPRWFAAKLGIVCALFAGAMCAHAATVVKFATGASNSAAILSDGTLWTWGNNMNGQLGNGTSVNADKPVNIGTGFTQVAVGSRYMVALKADGGLWMWGHALLKDKVFYETEPVQIGNGFAKLMTSDTAVKADGSVWFWGDAKSIYSAPDVGTAAAGGSLDALPNGIQQMVTGTYNALFVLDGGSIRYVGTNHFLNTWRTAYGSTGPTDSDFVQVALNTLTAAGVKKDGTLWQWTGDELPASLGSGYRQVAKGAAHTVALKIDGSVWAWGSNLSGQLGTALAADSESPQMVGNGFAQIAAANQHTLALTSGGTLMAWGSNSVGQLGTGAAGGSSPKPMPVVFDRAAAASGLGEVVASGPLARQTVTARVQISADHLASGSKGYAFLVAITADNRIFSYNGTGFSALANVDMLIGPQAWTNGLQNKTSLVFTDQDLSAIVGSTLVIGYGLGTSPLESLQEMLASRRYKVGYTVQ